MSKHYRRFSSPQKQQGASLFIALIVLLVITLLAVSSTREATLESRITGNFIEQQKLATGAETGLRDGEGGLTAPLMPLNETPTCPPASGGSQKPCLLSLIGGLYSYDLRFTSAGMFRPYAPPNGTEANPYTAINWYGLEAPSGAERGEAENPEYGSMMGGTATFRYEVNSQATNTASNNKATLRSTTAKFFDNGN